MTSAASLSAVRVSSENGEVVRPCGSRRRAAPGTSAPWSSSPLRADAGAATAGTAQTPPPIATAARLLGRRVLQGRRSDQQGHWRRLKFGWVDTPTAGSGDGHPHFHFNPADYCHPGPTARPVSDVDLIVAKPADEIYALRGARIGILRDTEFMAWVPIQAGQDHLRQYTKKGAIEALAELIWNGLDAEAPTVDVDIESQSMLPPARELSYVTRIVVTDTGHGIDPDKAQEQFSSLGDSWKKGLNGRTLNSERALHGSARPRTVLRLFLGR